MCRDLWRTTRSSKLALNALNFSLILSLSLDESDLMMVVLSMAWPDTGRDADDADAPDVWMVSSRWVEGSRQADRYNDEAVLRNVSSLALCGVMPMYRTRSGDDWTARVKTATLLS